jgi:hypothetical protein
LLSKGTSLMSKTNIIKFDPAIPARFKDWFGPPAVLTAEDLQIHNRILSGLFHDVKPQDFIECMFIEELAALHSERLSLRRRRCNVIRKAHNEKFEPLERELLQDAERRKKELREELAFDKTLAANSRFHPRGTQPQTQFAIEQEMNEAKTNKRLSEIDVETNKKLAELQKLKDGPIDEAACFDQWIDAVERIDKRLEVVERDILVTQKLLDEHRTGLGQRLRQSPEEVVDVEFAEGPASAGEEAVVREQAPANHEVNKESTGPMMASSVSELSSPMSAKVNGNAPIQLDAPAAAALPPSSGPTEQQ